VTVTVTNERDRVLPDLRVVDGVPEALAVPDGTARLGTALRAGESESFTYETTARRGVHAFGPTVVVARDLAGSVERVTRHTSETTLRCLPSLEPLSEPVPLRTAATRYVGRLETETGGEGLEFHATREYRPGDAMRRIDWNRHARTGELTTVEYREERLATVVVVVDVRAPSYVSPDAATPHAVDRSVDAAGRLVGSLCEAGTQVGVAAFGSESCWLQPGASVEHRAAARELLATHSALTPVPKTTDMSVNRWQPDLHERLSAGTQVLFCSPLCDDHATEFARHLDERGYPVTVISPDATADRTASQRLARVGRTVRLSDLRSAGIPAVDWKRDEAVATALARLTERGRR
jgi:uncharacterized protein (DUF58 family)